MAVVWTIHNSKECNVVYSKNGEGGLSFLNSPLPLTQLLTYALMTTTPGFGASSSVAILEHAVSYLELNSVGYLVTLVKLFNFLGYDSPVTVLLNKS